MSVAFDSTRNMFVCTVTAAQFTGPDVQRQAREALRLFFEHFYPNVMGLVRSREVSPFIVDFNDFGWNEKLSHWDVSRYLQHYIDVRYSHVTKRLRKALRKDLKGKVPTSHTVRILQNVDALMQMTDIHPDEEVTHMVVVTYDGTAPELIPFDRMNAPTYGFHSAPYHNLLAPYHHTSPAQMLLDRIHANWEWSQTAVIFDRPYYANYMAVIQGSGSGKSRLVKECAQSQPQPQPQPQLPSQLPSQPPSQPQPQPPSQPQLQSQPQPQPYVIYLCLRPRNSSDVPLASKIANKFCNLFINSKTNQNDALFDKFFMAVFQAVTGVAQQQRAPMSPSSLWKWTVDIDPNSFSQRILEAYYTPLSCRTSLLDTMKAASAALTKSATATTARFVIVLDEARQMLPGNDQAFFLAWRTWLANLGPKIQQRLFFLLLDDSPTVANIAAPTILLNDPSARIVRHQQRCFRPFYELPFLGPWPLPLDLQRILQGGMSPETRSALSQWPTLPRYNPLEHLFRFSRPLYLYSRNRYTDEPTVTRHMNAVIEVARRKVFGRQAEDSVRRRLQILVCYRYGLRPLSSSLQETFLADHGASLTRVYDNDEPPSMEVSYLPEPIVGELLCVARQRDDKQPWTRLENVVTAIEDEIRQRTLLRGMSKADRGELATAVYLLHAYEEATRAQMPPDSEYHTYSGLLSIADWVGTLAGQPLRPRDSITRLLEGSDGALVSVLASWISFTGWSVASEAIGPEVLTHAFCQRVGRICDDGHDSAVALVIPMVIHRGSTEPPHLPMHPRAKRPRRETGLKAPAVAAVAPTEDESSDNCPEETRRRSKRQRVKGETPPTSVAAATATESSSEDSSDDDFVIEPMGTEPVTPAWEAAKARLFLPTPDHARLGAVAIQVQPYREDVSLATAVRLCQEQVERWPRTAGVPPETMLSVLVMAGTGRVRHRSLPSKTRVMLFATRRLETPTTAGNGSQWIGLIVNGFSTSVVGGDAALEKLQRLVRIDTQPSASLLEECRWATLAEAHEMVRRQMGHRLSHQFQMGGRSELEADEAPRGSRRSRMGSVPSVFEGWEAHEVEVVVQRQRYQLTVWCPAVTNP